MKNCPQCGTPLMGGWCPACHPNPKQNGAYKAWAVAKMIQYILLLVFLVAICAFFIWACS